VDRAPDHVSAYQLTFEPGTALHARLEEGSIERLDEEQELAFFQSTRRLLAEAGLEPYEVSNFSLIGQECRHNVNYWENGPYVGVGPSAVSKLDRTRFGNPRSLGPWRAAVAAGRFPAAWEETPAPAVRLGESWWLGLRTRRGLSPAEALQRSGFEGPDPVVGVARTLESQGFLEREGARYRLTPRGWPVADAVARRLLEACAGAGATPPRE